MSCDADELALFPNLNWLGSQQKNKAMVNIYTWPDVLMCVFSESYSVKHIDSPRDRSINNSWLAFSIPSVATGPINLRRIFSRDVFSEEIQIEVGGTCDLASREWRKKGRRGILFVTSIWYFRSAHYIGSYWVQPVISVTTDKRESFSVLSVIFYYDHTVSANKGE